MPPADNPFQGVGPFTRSDHHRFFGRDADHGLICSRLLSARTTLLFAGSGVGKTSFLNAKLIPELEQTYGIVYHNQWAGEEPLKLLAATLGKEGTEHASAGGRDPIRLLPYFRRLAPEGGGSRRRGLLILDQFEEIFQHHKYRACIESFVHELATVIQASEVDVHVVFSMREEFLGEVSVFDNLVPDLLGNYYRLRNPNKRQAREIIERTVMAAGVACDETGLEQLVEDLMTVYAVDRQRSEPPLRKDYIVPPYTQIVCSRIWKRSGPSLAGGPFLASYRPGDADREIKEYCREKLQDLVPGQREMACEAFGFLMTKRGAKMAYAVSDLADLMRVNRDKLLGALRALSDPQVRILREFGDPPWFELYHDMYAPFLIRWKADFDEARKRRQRDLERELRGIAAQQKVWRIARWPIGIGAALLLAWFLGVQAWMQYDAIKEALARDDPYDARQYSKASKAYEYLHEYGMFLGSTPKRRWGDYWERRALPEAIHGHRDQALAYELQALAVSDGEGEVRQRRAALLAGGAYEQLVRTFRGEEDVEAVGLSLDAKTVLAAFRGGTVLRWNADDGKPLSSLIRLRVATSSSEANPSAEPRTALRASGGEQRRFVPQLRVVTFSPDGRWVGVVAASVELPSEDAPETRPSLATTKLRDRKFRLVDVSTGDPLPLVVPLPLTNVLPVVQFEQNSKRVAIAGFSDVHLCRVDAKERDPCIVLRQERSAIIALAFSVHGDQLATLSRNRRVRIWDVSAATGAPLKSQSWVLPKAGADRPAQGSDRYSYLLSLFHSEEPASLLLFRKNGQLLVKYRSERRLWNAARGLWLEHALPPSVVAAALAPDGRTLSTLNQEGLVSFLDLEKATVVSTAYALSEEDLDGSSDLDPQGTSAGLPFGWGGILFVPGSPVAFSFDGTRLLTGSSRGVIRLWQTQPSKTRDSSIVSGDVAKGAMLSLSPDATLVVSVLGGRVNVSGVSGAPRYSLDLGKEQATSLSFLPDGRALVIGTERSSLVWTPLTNKLVWLPATGRARAAGNDQNTFLVFTKSASAEESSCQVWHEARAKEWVCVWESGDCRGAVVSQSGKRLVHLRKKGAEVLDWNGRDWESVRVYGESLEGAALSRDGQRLLSFGLDKPARVLNVDYPDGGTVELLQGGKVSRAVFGPGSDRVTTIRTSPGVLAVWNIKNPEKPIASWAFEAERRILRGSRDEEAVAVVGETWVTLLMAEEARRPSAVSFPLPGRWTVPNFFLRVPQFTWAADNALALLLRLDESTVELNTVRLDLANVNPIRPRPQQSWEELRDDWLDRLALELEGSQGRAVPRLAFSPTNAAGTSPGSSH